MTTGHFDHLAAENVALRVRDAEVVGRFYLDAVGIGPGSPLLTLIASPHAPARPPRSAGLFHVAYLYPDRAALARAVRNLVRLRIPFATGDHGVSEAIYLADPEGNGIELCADRPREAWPFAPDGEVAMYTEEVDLRGLLAEPTDGPLAPPDLRIGHVHLDVSDLRRSRRFYEEHLGLAPTQTTYPGALFMARDGYHHHLGINTWRSDRPALEGALGLASFTFRARDRLPANLIDPDGIEVERIA